MNYPVNVNIDIVHQPELEFPSITVCNMNPVKRSQWEKYQGSATHTTSLPSSSGHKLRRKRAAGKP